MSQNQYKRKDNEDPLQQELWDDYMDNLEEEAKPNQRKSKLSSQVDQDLNSYQRQKKNKTRPLLIAGICLAVSLAVVGTAAGIYSFASRDDYSGAYEYEEPYEIEIDPEEEIIYVDESEKVGRDLTKPYFLINQQFYSLPVKYSELNFGERTVRKEAFAEEITTVGSTPVTLNLQNEWGEIDMQLLVVSPTGEEVPLSEAHVIGISSNSYDLDIPNYIGYASSKEYVLDYFDSQGIEYNHHTYGDMEEYTTAQPAPEDSGYQYYNLSLQMQDERVRNVTLLLSNEDLH